MQLPLSLPLSLSLCVSVCVCVCALRHPPPCLHICKSIAVHLFFSLILLAAGCLFGIFVPCFCCISCSLYTPLSQWRMMAAEKRKRRRVTNAKEMRCETVRRRKMCHLSPSPPRSLLFFISCFSLFFSFFFFAVVSSSYFLRDCALCVCA
mmetsp:Transcript_18169/g.45374  ORF Transcript_18169/g.45374 Transcript_18169/m.45374 type:complete len:150 (+) Transcript_18169:46-495(+)